MSTEVEQSLLDAPGYDDPFPEVDVEKIEGIRKQMQEDADAIAAREAYLGQVGEATIIDVNVGGSYVDFDVLLPDTTVGELRFTGPEFSDAPLYDFLELYGTDRKDPYGVLYADIPATFSEWKGWRTPIGKNTGLSVYRTDDDSSWFDIDEKTGGVTATLRVRSVYRTVSMTLGLVLGVWMASLGSLDGALIVGLGAWLGAWLASAYMFAAASGMSQPKMGTVTVPSESDNEE